MTSLIIFGMGLLCGAAIVAVGWCCFRDVEERREPVHYDPPPDVDHELLRKAYATSLKLQEEWERLQRVVDVQRALAEFPEWRRGPGGEA